MRTLFSLACFVIPAALIADDAPKAGTIVITDAAGKQANVTAWAASAGTRRLGWLAPADKAKDKKAVGPEALVVREGMEIGFVAGVVNLVPFDRIRSIRYGDDKVSVTVSTGGKEEDEQVLVGTTRYRGINKLTLKADVDMGAAGVATQTFLGGVAGGIKAMRFPAARAEAFKPGRPAYVVTSDKGVETAHKVSDLLPLYQAARGQEVLSTTMMFHKTFKLDVAKIKKISVAADEEGEEVTWRVARKDADEATLTPLENATIDGQKMALVGLVARVPWGYKLIPLKRVKSVEFDSTGPAKPKVEF